MNYSTWNELANLCCSWTWAVTFCGLSNQALDDVVGSYFDWALLVSKNIKNQPLYEPQHESPVHDFT